MNENFKNLMRYAFKEYYSCDNDKYEKVLDKITDSLIDIAHENDWVQEVNEILDEFN